MSTHLEWSAQLAATHASPRRSLTGDKIILPSSALEGLLAAAASRAARSGGDHDYDDNSNRSGSLTSSFDHFNPHSFSAERAARGQLRATQQYRPHPQLPHPLTFRLVNPLNGRTVYAGIREFSADEGEVVLSSFLRQALGLDKSDEVQSADRSDGQVAPPRVTVHARQLPKGTLVRLRPLEAGYDDEDWKSLLEQHLRRHYTTLTRGEVLNIPASGPAEAAPEYKFLLDRLEPPEDGICIVDTDLEVDIEPLNEEQARETMQRRLAKSDWRPAPGAGHGAIEPSGGALEVGQSRYGQIPEAAYVDHELLQWDRSKDIEIELGGVDDGAEVDLFVSPVTPRQRARPRDDVHVWGDFSSRYPKRIRISPTNVELESAEAIWISVHSYNPPSTASSQRVAGDGGSKASGYYVQASPALHTGLEADHGNSATSLPPDSQPDGPEEERCKNCEQWVPKRTLILHESFCLRNNVRCSKCGNVFKKNTPEWTDHWHCPHDDGAYGDTPLSRVKHDSVAHAVRVCKGCAAESRNLAELARHRTSTCPAKLIICRFCRLLVPQDGDDVSGDRLDDVGGGTSALILSDLTPHEYQDGARTTECHICDKIVRLRDMAIHLRHHDLERRTRPRPRICRNVNCGRALAGGPLPFTGGTAAEGYDTYGLCSHCYGPLYVTMYDPDGKALRRRVERRYLSQLMTGCRQGWCRNAFCKTARGRVESSSPATSAKTDLLPRSTVHVSERQGSSSDFALPKTTKEASGLVQAFVEGFARYDSGHHNEASALHFCVDETRQAKRVLAEMLAAQGHQWSRPESGSGSESGSGPELGPAHERQSSQPATESEYALEWCVAAMQAVGEGSKGDRLERAWGWLVDRAPTLQEEGRGEANAVSG
ncbi:MAG: hypothetical protein M1815_002491 [Lichina confinis]|nr:MAG: hypothetical protein M1815_002491 [Lichina confinis]